MEYYSTYQTLYKTIEGIIQIDKPKIINIGCGISHFEHYLCKFTDTRPQITSIDFNKDTIHINKICYKDLDSITYRNQSISSLTEVQLQKFQYAVIMNTIRHLSYDHLNLLFSCLSLNKNITIIINDFLEVLNLIRNNIGYKFRCCYYIDGILVLKN